MLKTSQDHKALFCKRAREGIQKHYFARDHLGKAGNLKDGTGKEIMIILWGWCLLSCGRMAHSQLYSAPLAHS